MLPNQTLWGLTPLPPGFNSAESGQEPPFQLSSLLSGVSAEESRANKAQ